MSDSYLTLKEAVERFRCERGSYGNAYDWYRRSARRYSRVTFGQRQQLSPGRNDCRVVKVGGMWMVDGAEFHDAIEEHRAALAERNRLTEDYHNHILHGEAGTTIYTDFGGYRVYRDFHHSWNASVPPWDGGGDWWTCSRCWGRPTLRHDKPECHTCSDWGSCGRDCTLSLVTCESGGTALSM